MAKHKNYTPQVDAGYGLIYRLNDLWNGADRKALAGDLDGWNHVLNALFRNLLYRGTMNVEYETDSKTNIKKVKLENEDSLIYIKFRDLIKTYKKAMRIALAKKDRFMYESAKGAYAETLELKDIWLRKFMQERGLYLREVEFDPSQAMWGG